MPDRPLIGATRWNQELIRAKQSNKRARQWLQRALDERPGSGMMSTCIAQAAQALAENYEALDELAEIGRAAKEDRTSS